MGLPSCSTEEGKHLNGIIFLGEFPGVGTLKLSPWKGQQWHGVVPGVPRAEGICRKAAVSFFAALGHLLLLLTGDRHRGKLS